MEVSEEERKDLLMRVKGESEKAGLKPNIQKTKIMIQFHGITLQQTERGKVEAVTDLISWAPKSLWTVTAAMKLKDNCFLEGNLCQT